LQDGAAVFQRRRGDGLVHDGEGIAHAAVAGFGEQGQAASSATTFSRSAMALSWAKMSSNLTAWKLKCWQRERMVCGNALGLGGGHHEDGPVGRLFEGLEDGVEGGVGDLVGFVEEEDFVLVARRADVGLGADGAHVVDAAVGGGVDFDEVEGVGSGVRAAGVAAGGDFAAGDAVQARLDCGAGRSLPTSVRQSRAMARMRAMVVLPMPRWPEKM
jgi:hypothetical protein